MLQSTRDRHNSERERDPAGRNRGLDSPKAPFASTRGVLQSRSRSIHGFLWIAADLAQPQRLLVPDFEAIAHRSSEPDGRTIDRASASAAGNLKFHRSKRARAN